MLERSVDVGQARRARATAAWEAAGLKRITLHECRHTYASLLMAAGYTVKELMEYMGHADLQMVARYVKLLPQPGEDDAADRLNAYLSALRHAGSARTSRRALRWTQRSSSAAGIRTSCPERTTFRSGWTLRSKWLRLIPSAAAASAA